MKRPRATERRAPSGRQRFPRGQSVRARSLVGLADLPTIVAVGPFDDALHAQQLAATFTAAQRTCPTQLVLLGTGAHRRTVVQRAADNNVKHRVHLVEGLVGYRQSKLLTAADIIVPSPASGSAWLLELMAAGRAVVVSASPAAARLIVPASAGLLYCPGDASAMTEAVLRLLTTPTLRDEMAFRAEQVAQHRKQRK